MIRKDIYEFLSNVDECYKWCMEQGLIAEVMYCIKCGKEMTKKMSSGVFRCDKSINGKPCNQKRSFISGSIFENSKISLPQILLIIYEWAVDSPVCRTAVEAEVSESTVSVWYSKLRNLAALHMANYNQEKIGGSNQIVEIDECCMSKRKYHRGRLLYGQQIWVFGGICRESGQAFIEFVPDRKRETLFNIIKLRIQPGSKIISDCWRAYTGLESILSDYQFSHETVNHSRNFVDAQSGAHTQTIEAFWSVIKRKLRKKGTNHGSSEVFNEKIQESLYKKKYGFHVFGQIINDISIYYD